MYKSIIIIISLLISYPLFCQNNLAFTAEKEPYVMEKECIQKALESLGCNYNYVYGDWKALSFYHRNFNGKLVCGKIDGLYEKDVYRYFNLTDKYNTPLKRKIFSQSEEYVTLSNRLLKERDFLLKDTFVISAKIYPTDYDFEKKCFSFPIATSTIVYTTIHYLDFNDLGIITAQNSNKGIDVPIEDELKALVIEEHPDVFRLVFVFTIDENLTDKVLSGGFGENKLIGKMQELYLMNIKDGSIYYSMSNSDNRISLRRYDNDIYVKYSKDEEGDEIPVAYYLKSNEKYIELEESVHPTYEAFLFEENGNNYYVFGKHDKKKYLLPFKTEGIVWMEKDKAYEEKCMSVRADYLIHPEKYLDVTKVVESSDNSLHCYIDNEGNDWCLETSLYCYHVLEKEGVYILFEDQKFIRKR